MPKIKENMDKSIHSHLYHQVIGRLRGKREKMGVTQVQLAEYRKLIRLSLAELRLVIVVLIL